MGYKIDPYFPGQKFTIEVDELRHQDGDLAAEIERQKALEKELNCNFIRINPARESFNAFDEIGRVQGFVSESNEKSKIKKVSNRLLELKFESNSSCKKDTGNKNARVF